jgi:GR25 family glycosyltransferase involved in LPS biosynthesis
MTNDYQFYCLSFNNNKRKENMKRRFETIGIDCIFNEGVSSEDMRINGRDVYNKCWSCMYGHLDMINDFYYNTNKSFGVFCEDDIYIHKDLSNLMPKIMNDFHYLNLDVLLLGYLLYFKIDKNNYYQNFSIKNTIDDSETYTYHHFPNDVWGTQMYMLSRNSAKKILDKYSFSSGYADKTIQDPTLTPFSADWTITKDGNRAAIYPMLALEEGVVATDHYGQQEFHKNCYAAHADDNVYY